MNDTSGPSKKRKAEEIAENGDDDRTGVTAPGEHDEITAGKAQVSKADCESKGNQENSTKSNDVILKVVIFIVFPSFFLSFFS